MLRVTYLSRESQPLTAKALSVVEASAEGQLTDKHFDLCRRMVETLRKR